MGRRVRGITGIGHVAIRVKDVDRALDFYVNKLGFAEMMRLDRDGRLWLVYLRITDDQYLEVFPDAVGDRAPPREANGLNHVCLTVDGIDRVIDQLRAAGIPLLSAKTLGADRNYQAWIEDPDGNRIELMEMAPDGMQAEAIERLRSGPSGNGLSAPTPIAFPAAPTAGKPKNLASCVEARGTG